MDDQAIEHPRILVIEDDDDQRELICEALRTYYDDREGVDVVGAPTGAEALASDLHGFDVILQDYNLPDIIGPDLIEKLLAKVDLPIIMVTSENVSETAIEAIRRGAQDYIVKSGDYLFALPVLVEKNIRLHRLKQENRRLQLDLEAMLKELQVKNVQLEESLEKLRTMATTDHLTGLANRRHFAEMLDRLFSEAVRYDFDLCCCMCDLDHYKRLNDALGHQVGDQLLETAADVIRSSLRTSDVAARYGGDEFVLLLPHTDLDRGLTVADRMRRELAARAAQYRDAGFSVTMSIGIASILVDRPGSADALVSMADRALYSAKEQGKDRIVPFSRVPHPADAGAESAEGA